MITKNKKITSASTYCNLFSKFFNFQNFRYLKVSKMFCEKVKTNNVEVEDPIIYQQHNPFAMEIILNQPKKLNSLDLKMIKSMLKRVKEWLPDNLNDTSSDEENVKNIPKMVLMSGNGKSFCAGGDVATICKQKSMKNGLKLNKDFFRYEYLLDYKLTRMKPIQVACWHGAVMGGGCGISVNAPIRIATESATFAMPETKIGLFPDVGATWFLPRIFNNNASMGLYIGLSGERIKGIDLAKCGYATHYVSLEKMAKLKEDLITKANNNTDLDSILDIVNSYSEFTYSPNKYFYKKSELINKTFKLDSLKECYDRLEKLSTDGNDDEKSWASTTLKNFKSYSPISMVITFEQIKRGAGIKSIEEAFNIESQLVGVFMQNNDFFEGVRALLIDKDNNPKWEFNSIHDIKEADLIFKYFDKKYEADNSGSDDD